jgi:hypothetical protein
MRRFRPQHFFEKKRGSTTDLDHSTALQVQGIINNVSSSALSDSAQ